MEITVKFFANFREATGKGKITVSEVSSVRELLDKLVGEFGRKLYDLLYESSTGKLRETVNILVNGNAINLLGGLNTKLEDGDTVAIFPPISGG
jgi:molybdopterin synthase sulfur carrier subunit